MSTQTTLLLITALLFLATPLDPRVEFEHNSNRTATRNFTFANIPSPSKTDAATKATLTMIDGVIDGGSGELSALNDGLLPTNDDDPGANLYFRASSMGGRFRMDFEAQSISLE